MRRTLHHANTLSGTGRRILLIALLFAPATHAIEPVSPRLQDPHRNAAGFFDIHVCNWPERELFFMSLFSTPRYDEVEQVEVREIARLRCDVLAPCGPPGVLNRTAVRELRCHLVCGAANNPLSGPEAAEELASRRILYVPDFLANAGGLIHLAVAREGGAPEDTRRRLAVIPRNFAAVMELANGVGKLQGDTDEVKAVRHEAVETIVLLLAPIVPHICHALWTALGHDGPVIDVPWPQADPAALEQDSIELVVQVNGKKRGQVAVPSDASDKQVQDIVFADANVARHMGEKVVKKVIVVRGTGEHCCLIRCGRAEV